MALVTLFGLLPPQFRSVVCALLMLRPPQSRSVVCDAPTQARRSILATCACSLRAAAHVALRAGMNAWPLSTWGPLSACCAAVRVCVCWQGLRWERTDDSECREKIGGWDRD